MQKEGYELRRITAYNDEAALKKFAGSVDIITYEFENIPTAPLAVIADKLYPNIDVLEICQHRIKEKETLGRLGIKTAPFTAVHNEQELNAAIQKIGLPAVLKTATMGYDGKGQWKVKAVDSGRWAERECAAPAILILSACLLTAH